MNSCGRRSKSIYNLFIFCETGSKLLISYDDVYSEYEAINKYLKSINKEYSNFKFLGELRGIVYRMNFEMTVDGIENEYMIVHNSL